MCTQLLVGMFIPFVGCLLWSCWRYFVAVEYIFSCISFLLYMYVSCYMDLGGGVYSSGVAGSIFIWFWFDLSHFLSKPFLVEGVG